MTTTNLVLNDLTERERSRQVGVNASFGNTLTDSGGAEFGVTGGGGSFSSAALDGTTQATIGAGNVTVTGQSEDETAAQLAETNRDINNATTITRDTSFDTGNVFIDVGAARRAEGNVAAAVDFLNAFEEIDEISAGGLLLYRPGLKVDEIEWSEFKLILSQNRLKSSAQGFEYNTLEDAVEATANFINVFSRTQFAPGNAPEYAIAYYQNDNGKFVPTYFVTDNDTDRVNPWGLLANHSNVTGSLHTHGNVKRGGVNRFSFADIYSAETQFERYGVEHHYVVTPNGNIDYYRAGVLSLPERHGLTNEHFEKLFEAGAFVPNFLTVSPSNFASPKE